MRRLTWFAALWMLLMAFSFNGTDEPHDDEVIDDTLNMETLMTTADETKDPESQALPLDRSASADTLTVQSSVMVSQLTGGASPSRTDALWNIVGTDLGFSFEHDDKIYMVFGDTWGRGGGEGPDWRSNIMVTVEADPNHGYVITDVIADENGEATELIPSLKEPGTEYTVIPTSAVTVGDRMYMHYMSINDWDQKWWGYKEPIMNASGIAYSDDNGHTWIEDETAVWEGDSAFSQTAMVERGDYVYVFGTPAGRFGAAVLMRVPGTEILHPEHYEYWTGDTWSPEPDDANVVVPAPVGELSVRWNPYHQRWFMMYKNEINHNVVLRTAQHLTGPWDEEREIVSGSEFPTLYAPFMLPITGPDIYFTMSLFQPEYQVFIMRTTVGASY